MSQKTGPSKPGASDARKDAKRLAVAQEAILQHWEKMVRAQIRVDRHQKEVALRDDLPEFFEALIAALSVAHELPEQVRTSAKKHGKHRAFTGGYTIEDVLAEYRLLHRSMIEILNAEVELSAISRTIITESLLYAIERATKEFMELREYARIAHEDDIRQRQTAEKAARESDEKFRAIFEQAASGIILVGLDGHWLDANQKFCSIVGYSVEELKALRFSEITYREDVGASQEMIDKLVRNELPNYSIEKRYVHKSGRLVWISGVVSLVRDHTGQPAYLLAVVVDNDERKQLEAELTDAKLAAESANLLKSAFLANVSHEIRTPLGAILGFTELMKDDLISPTERTGYLNVIERNCKALTRVIDDVLDLSKVEAGRLEIEYLPFSLKGLIGEVLELFHDQASKKGISVASEIAPGLPDWIVSDPMRIRQILVNIVGNAVKFTTVGGVRVIVDLLHAEGGEGQFRISVVDTGPGLTPAQSEKLFQPFTQADNSTTRRFGGTGLGLAISRRLARVLGGDVTIDGRTSAKGCWFTVSLKAKLQRAADEEKSSPEVGPSKGPGSGGRPLSGLKVLVVDDSEDNRFLIKMLLTQAGVLVDEAGDGNQGVRLAWAGNYDLVLMDIQMPELDGYQATAKLRSMGYTKPILALTAHAMKEEAARTKAAGCNDHLTKPIDRSILFEKITQYAVDSSQSS